ncbi:MAG: hypothetical protein AAFN77_07820 [Planctomycetota bacterium]
MLDVCANSSFALLLGAVGIAGLIFESIKLMAILLAPFVGYAMIIHWLEHITQTRMAERFGWKSVIWTGWLGTPIHELSHAIMCPIFRHRVDEVALFEPDRQSGRLGYVRHSFTPGNWYQEFGNFFIGIAPLIGGSLALTALLWLFYPGAIAAAYQTAGNLPGDATPLQGLYQIVSSCFAEMAAATHLLTARFWLFCYLVLCVGGHMAPSPSDYEGASRGFVFVGGGLFLFTLILAANGTDSRSLVASMVGLLGPLFAVFGFAIVLCSISAIIVWGVTALFPQRYTVR